jgi:hypothetical protein
VRTGAVLVAAVVLLICPRVAVHAQPARSASSLVVVIPNDRQYHQPSCPLVAKAGRNVKVMKLAEAERRGLKPHDCDALANGGQPSAADANAVIVYVQPDDNKYHKAGCPRLKGTPTRLTLAEAGKKYWPCPVCKPPIRKNPKAG